VPGILPGTPHTSTGIRIALDVRVHSAECGMRRVEYAPYLRHAARASVAEFRVMSGWRSFGAEFDIPIVGPHGRMQLDPG